MGKCNWALAHPILEHYHDVEWGVPIHDDRLWFEFLLLEGAQAGLSWLTILKKREAYQRAFDNFDAEKITRYNQDKITRLLADSGIIRNRLKIHSAVSNAQAFLQVQSAFGSFDHYIWQFVGGRPKQNVWQSSAEIPVTSSESDAMSKDLKKRGFKFVGSTICYSTMQATGMVNDHIVQCARHGEIRQAYQQ